MTEQEKALKLATECGLLPLANPKVYDNPDVVKIIQPIIDFYHLAQQQLQDEAREPVAWILKTGHGTEIKEGKNNPVPEFLWAGKSAWKPLYLHSLPDPQWKMTSMPNVKITNASEIELDPDDAALVIRKGGVVEVFYQKKEPNEQVNISMHMIGLCTQFLADENMLEDAQKKLSQRIKSFRN